MMLAKKHLTSSLRKQSSPYLANSGRHLASNSQVPSTSKFNDEVSKHKATVLPISAVRTCSRPLSLYSTAQTPFRFNSSRRGFATGANASKEVLTAIPVNSVVSCASPQEEMDKFELAAQSAVSTTGKVTDQVTSAASQASNSDIPVWEPSWYLPQDHFVDLIHYMHDFSGMNYAITIAAITTSMRVIMLPLFINAQRNSSRMAHMRPEMDALKQKIDTLDRDDAALQQRYMKDMQTLFKKYDCNPLKGLIVPLVQLPAFMGMFFALRKMPEYFPNELSDGGMFWFQDLTAGDSTYILPVITAGSFLLMMELNKEQMMAGNPQQGKMMLTFFRGVAVLMVPLTSAFPAALFCYWTANNTFSLVQSSAFKVQAIRKSLGIWEPPKPVPGAPKPKGIMDMAQDWADKRNDSGREEKAKDEIKLHNAAIDKKQMEKQSTIVTKRKRRKGANKRGKR
jgi:YidC/Oxa1 family membrane protein insertase